MNTKNRTRGADARLALAVTAALACSVTTTAAAQAQAAGALDDIVVTARKTEERLQDVPLAITALSSEQLAQRQVRDLADVATLTAGLNFESYLGGNGTPVIRGAAQGRITDLDQNVSAFYDGIYLPRQYVVSTGVLGLDRVEVVKGPQSALYGRNAFMGAINYVTQKPGDELRASVEATVGGYDRRDVSGALSGALIDGMLYARIAAGHSEFDGDARNGHPNAGASIEPGSTGRLGGWDDDAYQARIVFRPIESLELDAGAYRFDVFRETPPVVRVQQSTRDTNCGVVRPNGQQTLYCGELDWRFRPLPGGGPIEDVVVDPRGYGVDLRSTLLRGHAEWTPLDPLKVVYEYGKLNARVMGGGGSDRDPVLGTVNIFAPTAPRGNQFQLSPVGDLNFRSNELRVEYTVREGLSAMLGYYDSTLNDLDRFPIAPGLPRLGTAPLDITQPGWVTLTRGYTTVDARAVFGRVEWRVSDRWRVGLEGRDAREEKTLISGPTSLSPAVRTLDGEWSSFTPRATVDFRIDDARMLYATAAKGVKSGGFNTGAILPEQFRFEQDENWTYELGSKNTLLDGRLRLDAAVFYVDWKNQQVSCSALGAPPGFTPPSIICNIGQAEIRGVEAELTWSPVTGLTLLASASFNDAKYADDVIDQRARDFRTCDDVVCARSGDVGGNQLPRQSKVQASGGADWEVPLGEWRAFVGGDVGYKSKQYADPQNLAWVPSRTLVNLRAGVRGDAWDATVWAKNAFDENYAASAFITSSATDTVLVPIAGPWRTYGLTVRYAFGPRS
jgi:iron complex outermembrane receptor protein